MNNNADMQEIYSKLGYLKNLFDPSKDTYKIIQTIIDGKLSKEEALKKLETIDDYYSFSADVQTYYDLIAHDLNKMVYQEDEIQEKSTSVYKSAGEVTSELNKRNVYVDPIKNQQDINFQKGIEQTNYINSLDADVKHLEEVKGALEKPKAVGESFDKTFDQDLNVLDLKKPEEQVANNVKEIVNPDRKTLLSCINYYKDNQKSGTNLNIKVVKSSKNPNNREVHICYQGISVSEKDPKMIITYTDGESFEQDDMYEMVYEYATDSTTQSETDVNNTYTNISVNGNTLELENLSDETVNNTRGFVDSVQNSEVSTDSTGNVISLEEARARMATDAYVRVRTMDNAAKVNIFVVIISLLVIICLTMLVLLFIKYQ